MEYKMEQWKGTKCQFGYINKQKKFQFAMLMLDPAVIYNHQHNGEYAQTQQT